MSEPKPITKPTKTLSWQEFYPKTDNANKLMDRVWYCMKMYPAIDFKCLVIAPIGLSMQPVTFPTDDSRSEFRVDYCEAMGKKMFFVFVLDPNISEEDKKKQFDLLEKENGVLREWFVDVQWEENYELGSTGDPIINPKKTSWASIGILC